MLTASTKRILLTATSALAGAVLGALLAILGPILVAVVRGDDFLHKESYGDWMIELMYALPIVLGTVLGVLAWRGKWRRGLMVAHVLLVVVAMLLVFLGASYVATFLPFFLGSISVIGGW